MKRSQGCLGYKIRIPSVSLSNKPVRLKSRPRRNPFPKQHLYPSIRRYYLLSPGHLGRRVPYVHLLLVLHYLDVEVELELAQELELELVQGPELAQDVELELA
jgi:hypothetical protein